MVIVITVGNPPPPPQATAYILEDASSFNTYVLHTYIRIYYKENHFICYSGLYLAQRGAVFYTWPPQLLHTYWRMPPLIHMYYILIYVSIIKKIIFLATPGPPWLRPDPPGYTWPPQATPYILEDASFNTYVLHTYIRIYYCQVPNPTAQARRNGA